MFLKYNIVQSSCCSVSKNREWKQFHGYAWRRKILMDAAMIHSILSSLTHFLFICNTCFSFLVKW
ncbi:hypothetical protein NC653_015366 [Populus alba x Populus x berolinensis]|uniref:Uncharacterized protein n=1 Tax=Populus alba x Populus x berolinensis TaxID=444605 RepID=A0AAD6QKH2_9ROSI|nr:hypothetical protein NC653_015366 [Populus alba x Populus x berolinensis]